MVVSIRSLLLFAFMNWISKPARRSDVLLLIIRDIGDCPLILLVQVIATLAKVVLAA